MNDPRKIREFGKCRLDFEKRVLWHKGKPVPLPLKSLELLCLLVEHGGEVVTKDEIWQKVWRDAFVEETNLTHNIYLLRKTFKDLGEKDLIQTVPRRGYRFTGKIREIEYEEISVERHTLTQTLIEEVSEENESSPQRSTEAEVVETEKRNIFSKIKFSRFHVLTLSILVFLIVLFGGFGFWRYRNQQPKTTLAEIKSIAVLPFRTIGENKEVNHQGLGLADVLITRLSVINELNVRPTSAVIGFENQDSISVGQKLKVDAVLEGTIYRVEDKVRVTARLLKVGDQTPIWAGEFEEPLRDELRLQNEIALQLINALAIDLSGNEKNALTKRFTESADAYQLYLKGRVEWNKRNSPGAANARRLFQNAIEKDPKFALAYAGLADTLAFNMESHEGYYAARKALELDPNLGEAYASLGFIYIFHYWDWQKAEDNLKKAIELNPNCANAHHWYATLLAIMGKTNEAKAEMRRALEINPLSHNFLADLGQIYYFAREYEIAKEYCNKALEINPDFSFTYQYLYHIYLKTGEYDKAIEAYLIWKKQMGSFPYVPDDAKKKHETYIDSLRQIYREGGIQKLIRYEIEDNLRGGNQGRGGFYFLAMGYAFLGEKEKALESLEKDIGHTGFFSAYIKADPIFDNLRDEPRYKEILRKIKLD